VPELIDYNRVARQYQSGRGLSQNTLDAWRLAVSEFVPERSSPAVLDLGAGTGIFTRAWATWCDARVVAVEPSEGMRLEAFATGIPNGSTYVAGTGEFLPLRDSSVDIAWLSTVLHHFRDRDACAHELGRVVVRGGVLLIRGLFSDAGQIGWLDSFPGADDVRARMPSIVASVALFERYGFQQVGLREVIGGERETVGESVAWVRNMRTADTLLASFDDEQFRVGLTNLESLPADQPMTHSLALLAMRRG